MNDDQAAENREQPQQSSPPDDGVSAERETPSEDVSVERETPSEDFVENTPEEEERQRTFRLAGLTASYDTSGQGTNIATYGTQYNFQQFTVPGPTTEPATLLPPEQVRDLLCCTVPTESSHRLAERLPGNVVMLLRGQPGSGWRTSAYAALLGWAGHREDTPLAMLNTSLEPGELTGNDLSVAKGFVLDARDASWLGNPDETLARLRAAATQAACRIVVLVKDAVVSGDCLVDHEPPLPTEVFRAWLSYRLDVMDAWKEHNLDSHGTQLMEMLDGCSPDIARDLAVDVANGIQRDVPIDEILATQGKPVRERLRRALVSGAQLSRCFLISSGVLHHLSEATVSRAALRLEALIREQENERMRPGPPVWEPLQKLLAYDGLRTSPPQVVGDGQRLWLRSEARAQVLHVAWEEVPALRGILHSWLHELTDQGDQEVAIRAAQAVAQLAACNFDAIRAEFLDPWSERGYGGNKLVMATLEAASLNPMLLHRTHRLLEEWSAGNYKRRTTAAMAYGSQIGLQDIDKALAAFRRVVQHSRSVQLHGLVATALTEVYVDATAERILGELGQWVASDAYGLRRTAAVAFTRLAQLPEGSLGRPALVESGDHENLVTLWCHAVDWSRRADPDPERRTPASPLWQLLRRWVERPSCEAVVENVFRTVGSLHRRLRLPLHVHLRAWQAQKIVTPEQRAKLRDLLNRGEDT